MEIRTVAPAVNNKYYVKTNYGGYNKAILINKDTGSVLPNCVGYAYGRFMECAGITSCNLPTSNAKNWYNSNHGYLTGNTARQGAIACWGGGNYGHVAFVEEVYADGSILTSQSSAAVNGQPGVRFETKIVKYPYTKTGLIFQGFIYNPYIDGEKPKDKIKMYGCDVSEHNSLDTDISKYDYVIIRVAYGTNQDKKCFEWKKKCEDLNIPYGVYIYSYAIDVAGALSEADFVCNLIKGWNVELGVWFDMEDSDQYKANRNALRKDLITQMTDTFCQRVQDYGYYTGVYASQSWFGTYIDTEKWDRWVASWGTNDGTIQRDTEYLGTMLQYASHGGLDKDVSYCDISHYKSYPVWEKEPQEDKQDEKQEEGSGQVVPPSMPDDDYLFKMSNKTYDFIKFLTHIIPIFTTFYIALANIWKWPLTDSIIATITAFDSMLIAIINMSTIGYNSSKGVK